MEEFDLEKLVGDERFIVCRQYEVISALVLQSYASWILTIFERLRTVVHPDFYDDGAPQTIKLRCWINKTSQLEVVTKNHIYTCNIDNNDEAIKLLYAIFCVYQLEDDGLRIILDLEQQKHLLRHMFGDTITLKNSDACVTFVVSQSHKPYTEVYDGPYKYNIENTQDINAILELPLSQSNPAIPPLILQ